MSEPVKDIKRRLMLALAEDKQIFDLLSNDSIDPDCYDDLIFNNIFPFLKVDFTETEAGNYIGVGIDYPLVRKNDTYRNSQITFLIICNTNTLRIGNGSYSRVDAIAERIVELFQNNNMFGFPMKLYSDMEGIHSSRFYYRELIMQSQSSNIVGECG